MLEMTNENFARLLRGLRSPWARERTVYSCISFLRQRSGLCTVYMGSETKSPTKEHTLRSLVRRSAKHHAEVTVEHAKRVFSRALKKLDTSQGHDPTLRAMIVHLLKQEPLQTNSQPSGNA